MLEDFTKRVEDKYGENIIRNVIQTTDFSFPSEDYTGQINEVVAKKTREVLKLHSEISGPLRLPVEEVKITEEQLVNGKKKRKKRNMERYAPLIFVECYVKHKNLNKVANSFELALDPKIQQKVNPNNYSATYRGVHLFVMVHGFQGSSYDMRMFKNIIQQALPESLFLCSSANE